jgi:outer membrane lipoprotein SlyB
MNLKSVSIFTATAACLSLSIAPDAALAQRHHHHVRHVSSCHSRRAVNGTVGAVVGGVGGGLIGSSLTHGSVVGTLAGAGGGALAGHAIGKHTTHC